MANVLINDQHLTDIADAIRLKKSSKETFKPKEMADAIKTISTASGDYIFDDLISKTYTGEFYCETAEKIPASYMISQPITMATGLKATTIDRSAFYNCLNLVSANFPKVKTIYSGAFQNCESLTDIKIPAVTTIYGYAFKNCSKLEKLDLGHITAFSSDLSYNEPPSLEGCAKLTHLIVRTNSIVTLPWLPSQFKNNIDIAWIYVPTMMYHTYCQNYADYGYTFRKIEDYPDICG